MTLICFLRSQRLKQGTIGDTGAARSRSWPWSGCWWWWYKVEGTWDLARNTCGLREERRQSPSLPEFLKELYSILPHPSKTLCAFEGTLNIWRRVEYGQKVWFSLTEVLARFVELQKKGEPRKECWNHPHGPTLLFGPPARLTFPWSLNFRPLDFFFKFLFLIEL